METASAPLPKPVWSRISIIDGLRGLSVVLMVGHHFLWDCATFLGAPYSWFSNPVMDVLHYIFAGCFILLSGVSSRFSRSNLKRGLKTLGCAAVITLVTVLMDMDIWFGVLHLLAFCMLFYGLTYKLWERIPWWFVAVFCIAMIPVSNWLRFNLPVAEGTFWSYVLWPVGWNDWMISSSDYFSVFPWLFVFLFGTMLGRPIKEKKLPGWFYTAKIPFFPAVGRHALLVYMLHQPVLYGITMAIAWLFHIG